MRSRHRRLHWENLEGRALLAADLLAYWRADDLLQSDGEAIETWTDAVGGVAAQAIGQPTLALSQVGGRSAVRFDPGNGADGFRIDRRTSPLSGADDFSLAVVFATSTTNLVGTGGPWFENTALVDASNLGLTTDWGLSLNQAGQVAFGLGAGFSKPSVTLYSQASGLNDGGPHIVSITRQRSHVALYVDGQPAVERDDAGDASRSREIDIVVGMRDIAGFAFTGVIGQIRIYRGSLSADEVDLLHTELQSFYDNRPPVAQIDRFQAIEDEELRIDAAGGVLANDQDPDGDALAAQLVTPPARGSLALHPDGSFVYLPEANYSGTDLFSYKASDGSGLSETVFVQIDVAPVNDPPVASGDSYFAIPPQALIVDAGQGVLANDEDEDGERLTAILVEPPQHGDLLLAADGSFQYRPEPRFLGEDRFRYRASDPLDQSAVAQVVLHVTAHPVMISELMARNARTLSTRTRASRNQPFRGSSESYDWIELHNLLGQPLDVGGLHLTDSRRNPTKYQLPFPAQIPANGYLLLFASGLDIRDTQLDEKGHLHTNFKLDAEGEYLALTSADGSVLWEFADGYPPQKADVSYGADDRQNLVYFSKPTPGSVNGNGLDGWVAEVQFGVERGFFQHPFSLSLTTTTPGAMIRYTRDGTVPTAENGLAYTEPLTIDTTTTLRAGAFRDGWLATDVTTHTYLFPDAVVRQAGVPPGYPARWKGLRADYDMSQNQTDLPLIAGDPNHSLDTARRIIQESLLSLPTLSIVLPPEDLFDARRGIYVNPTGMGERWERAASVEYLLPDGGSGFQIDAGLRISGGTSRDLSVSPKQSLRLFFRSEYGQGRLNYRFFEDSPVDSFNTLILRANVRDSWVSSSLPAGPRSRATYIRDQWAKMAEAAMGQPATSGRFVHLYLNGLYWGIYNPTERPDAAFAAEHFGGDDSDYDVVKFCCPDELVDGDRDEWDQLLALSQAGLTDATAYQRIQGNRPDGTRDPDLPVLIDIDNFIDYVINGQYHAAVDWPGNYYVVRRRGADSQGFKFITWDNDLAFPNLSLGANKVRTDPGHPWWTESPGVMDIALRGNAEYRLRFADRVHRHLFHDGSLTPQATARLWSQIADRIEKALIAESARWGDYRRDVAPSDGERILYTPQQHWRPTIDRMLQNYFPARTDRLLRQLRSEGLYPQTDAAEFLVDGTLQYGGLVGQGARLAMSVPQGTIYYTLDGTDPRLVGGANAPGAIPYTEPLALASPLTVKARVLDGQQWSALSEATFTPTISGDFNDDQRVDAADIDLLCSQIRSGGAQPRFDLSRDGQVDRGDFAMWVSDIAQTTAGDANLDRTFDSRDLVMVFQAGEYEDGLSDNSGWSAGDWNCDGEFGSSDLVAAFRSGSYLRATEAASLRTPIAGAIGGALGGDVGGEVGAEIGGAIGGEIGEEDQ